MHWLETLQIHDFHQTAQRLSELQQQHQKEASHADQTSNSTAVGELKIEQDTDREETNVDTQPGSHMSATKPEIKLELEEQDEAESGVGHQTSKDIAAEDMGLASCGEGVSSSQEHGNEQSTQQADGTRTEILIDPPDKTK